MDAAQTPQTAEGAAPDADTRDHRRSDADLQRKIDQAYELAGCARMDRDRADAKRWTDEAERLRGILRSRR